MTTKVFISYAHESETLADDVLKLSNFLRSKGLDCEIDQYEESPPEGWPKWMMRQVQEAKFVLIICSKLFYERSIDFSGKEKGLGVKWETSLILQELYQLNTNNTKFIPVLFHESNISHIPLPLKPYTYYNVSKQNTKEKLAGRLLGASKSKRPPIGQKENLSSHTESLDSKERKTIFFNSMIDIELWDEAEWKGVAYITDMSLKNPPTLGFLFNNFDKGSKIFAGLKGKFGEVDLKDEIRISFIEELSESAPKDYRVHFGSDWDVVANNIKEQGLSADKALIMSTSRIHEMNPESVSFNLAMFKQAYAYFGKYYITNMVVKENKIAIDYKNLILKQKVYFRKKPEILLNENDPDIVALGGSKEFDEAD